jgi:hypothetical protein
VVDVHLDPYAYIFLRRMGRIELECKLRRL